MRILIVACALAACGPAGRETGGTPDAPGPVGDSPPVVDMSRVYAHSGGTLYRMNAQTFAAVAIGPMAGIGTQSMTDLAIDKDDHMVGITLDKLYSIDPATGAATLIKDLSQSAQGFTSLSFVPDPVNSALDILVSANSAGDVFKIDPVAGTAIKIGNYGMSGTKKIGSSGDLIGVRGFGIYATVNVGTDPNDYLAKIDPANGWKAEPRPYATMHKNIFGLGFWGGKIYGFVDEGATANSGKMISIDPMTGASTDLSSGNVRWFGAAVATDAPTIE